MKLILYDKTRFSKKRRTGRYLALFFVLLSSIVILTYITVLATADTRVGTVSVTSGLTVRAGPGTENSVLGYLPNGQAVTIIEDAYDSDSVLWYKIQYGSSFGYVHSGYVINVRYVETIGQTVYTYGNVNSSSLNVRIGPSTSYTILRTLDNGSTLTILDTVTGADNATWYYVRTSSGIQGYVFGDYVTKASITINWDASFEVYMENQGFPDSYKDNLRILHYLYPEWKFIAINTGLNWNDVIVGETKANTIQNSTGLDSWKSTSDGAYNWVTSTWYPKDSGGWVQSSDEMNAYYIDPRNFLSSESVFQFLQLSFNSSLSEGSIKDGLRSMLSGTFMYPSSSSDIVTHSNGDQISYIDVLYRAGVQYSVNPYILAGMIIQEQGHNGGGGCISGTNSNYPGYFNYFDVGAYTDSTFNDAVERGLWYASGSGSYNRPWNTREKSIFGGTQFFTGDYITCGQDTDYLKKFNVDPDDSSDLFRHQYMTNVQGAASEGCTLASAYSESMRHVGLSFYIPVYNNMPDSTTLPLGDGSPNNKLSSLSIGSYVLTPVFSLNTNSYQLVVDTSTSSVTVSAAVYDSTASIAVNGKSIYSGGSAQVQLAYGDNKIEIVVTAESGDIRAYIVTITRQVDKPKNVTATAGNGEVTLTWGAAANATAYAVAYQNGSSWVTLTLTCTNTTYTATNLIAGKAYTFLVQAKVNGSWTPFGSNDYVTATPTGATKPTAQVTGVGDGSVTLNWNAVSGATKYAIAYLNGSDWTTLTLNYTGTTYTATGLINSKAYTFLVQSYADGKWSSFSSSDYVTGTPSDVTRPSVTAAAGDSSATLAWDAVAGATSYAIAYQNGSSWVTLTMDCTDTGYTATNLVAGKMYTFLVQAKVNGSWSKFDSSNYVTVTPFDATRPVVKATAGDGSATLTWDAIAGATSYAIAYQNGSGWVTLTLDCTDTAYTATNLVAGKTYTFLVQAKINGSWSSFNSNDYVTVTPTGVIKPIGVAATATDGGATLTWTAVPGADKYAIAYQNGTGWTTLSMDCPEATYTATNLVSGKTYTFLVQSCTDGKWSAFTSADYVTVTPTGATKPTAAVSAVGDGSVTLNWNAVSGATRYAIAYWNGSDWTTLTLNCTDTTYTATGLANHEEYTFLVQSYADSKWSSFSSSDYVTGTPFDANRPLVKAVAGDASATLTWDAVADATAYAIAYQDGSTWVTLTLGCTDTTYTAADLIPGKAYTFLVQAKVNGSWSKFDSTDYVAVTPTDS